MNIDTNEKSAKLGSFPNKNSCFIQRHNFSKYQLRYAIFSWNFSFDCAETRWWNVMRSSPANSYLALANALSNGSDGNREGKDNESM